MDESDDRTVGDLPTPWKRALDRAYSQGLRDGAMRGFRVGVWLSVFAWFMTAAGYMLWLSANQ